MCIRDRDTPTPRVPGFLGRSHITRRARCDGGGSMTTGADHQPSLAVGVELGLNGDWVNHRRLHGEIGLVPPVEFEAPHHTRSAPCSAGDPRLHPTRYLTTPAVPGTATAPTPDAGDRQEPAGTVP